MAEAKFDPTKPEHFALFAKTDARLRYEGYTDEQIAEVRKAQADGPAARTPEEYAAGLKTKSTPKAESKA